MALFGRVSAITTDASQSSPSVSSTPPWYPRVSAMNTGIDETTALLSSPNENSPTRTPLPKRQLAILMLVQICEPLVSQSIYPYINELISELGIASDEKKVGYYAGLMSSFFMIEAFTVLHWSRASDRIGRKPILLIGLFGSSLSMLCFGLSRTFWTLLASRCLTGLLNGNIGIMKSAMGDITDPSNRAEGFAYIPVVGDAGAALGVLVGGFLARPRDSFPLSFSAEFWSEHPYFLPCLAIGGFVFMTCLVALAFLKETVPRKDRVMTDASDVRDRALHPSHGPRPVRELLTFPVVISISNYASLSFLFISTSALLPLVLAMPIEIGGLGLPPAKIGLILAGYGTATAVFQVLFCAKLIQRFGPSWVFIAGISASLPIFALFPVMNAVVQGTGRTPVVWALLGCILVLGALLDTSFAAIFMYVTASAPTASRGTVNGLAQTAVSMAQAIGPAITTSLLSLSLESNLLGGYAVYTFMLSLSALALLLGTRLPVKVWEVMEE
ncbi:major facilitator superfamily domain-containing protein [Mycena rosella]|uniref:Major facilitator superfamily domain-containing protein n=1 Tax=Mycena rosella TaxID=1033263 RepID=A0AAD7CNT3_MYCRO|nr:major facilitator superfamily domain-containing protein [Mycena rosella]